MSEIIDETIEFDAPTNNMTPPPMEHTLLKVWQDVLSNGVKLSSDKASMAEAVRLVSMYDFLEFHDVETHRAMFYRFIEDARLIIDNIIEENPDALKNVEDDATENRELYLDVILQWSKLFYEAEQAFDSDSSNAAAAASSYLDAQAFLLGGKGLIQHLETIGFEYDEEDAELIRAGVYGDDAEGEES